MGRRNIHPCDVPSLGGVRAWGQAEVGHGAFSRPTGHRQVRRVLDRVAASEGGHANAGVGQPWARELSSPGGASPYQRNAPRSGDGCGDPVQARHEGWPVLLSRIRVSYEPRAVLRGTSSRIVPTTSSGSSAGPATQGDQRSHSDTISIAKREDVAILDSFIGQKT